LDTQAGTLSISQFRSLYDSQLEPYEQRARTLYPVTIEDRVLGGVRTQILTPKAGLPSANRRRVLMNLHGGGFFAGAGTEALIESLPLAGGGHFKVVSVDYRQGPEYRFPAASEDVAAVYTELLKTYPPGNIGLYGCSAGGILSAMALVWFQTHHLPRPGAVGIFNAGAFGSYDGPPTAPGSWGGDSRFTAPPLTGHPPLPIDPAQGQAGADYFSAYLRDVDLATPLVSPALFPRVLSEFPPILLISGTRAWDMSAAVQTQRALTKAGVEARLHLWDGMGHCFFFDVNLPESQEAFAVMTQFFNARLGH
jgi:acetyl esterase/lipase